MENCTAAAAAQGKPHVVMLPTHGMGHLIPMVELAKRLVSHHGFSITILNIQTSGGNKAQKSLLSSLPPSITSHFLPPVPHDDLPADAAIETVICADAARSVPAVRDALSNIIHSGANVVAFLAVEFQRLIIHQLQPIDSDIICNEADEEDKEDECRTNIR